MKSLSCVLAVLLLLAPTAQSVAVGQTSKNLTTPEKIKSQLGRLGIGEKAKATIITKDGAKIKGYIYRAGENDFELRDHKTNAPTTIRYTDVAKVDGNRGHSVARNVLIIAGIGTAIVLASVYFAIARNER